MREIKIGQNDDQQRLDRYLWKIFPKASKSFLQKMIRQKKIKVNKKRAMAETFLEEGDLVQIYLYEEVLQPLEERRTPHRSHIMLSYAFENDHLAVIDKPAGLLSHAAKPEDYGDTVVDALIADLLDRGEYIPRKEASFTPSLVNRLDFQTAGLLIGAKTHAAALLLSEAIRENRIHKHYYAFVEGVVEQGGEVDLPLMMQDGRARVSEEGKESLTRFRPIWVGKQASCLDISLETGRTHQIRAHLASIGHPLVGDRKYGAKLFRRQFSHHLLLSYRLVFDGLTELAIADDFYVYSKQTEEFLQLKKQLEVR